MKKVLSILIILVVILLLAFLFCLYKFHQIPYIYNPDIPKDCCKNYPTCCVGRYGVIQWQCSGICEKGGIIETEKK